MSGWPERLRVLLACDHIDHGGALHGGGRHLIELLRGLERREGVEPEACVLRRSSDVGRRLQREGLRLRFFGDHRFDPSSLWKLDRLVSRRRFHVLHVTDFAASTYGRLVARRRGLPVLVHVHSHHSEHQPRGYPWYAERAYRALAGWTDRALAVSPSVRDFAVERMGLAPADVEVLSPPLPEHSFREASPEEVREARERHGIPPGAPVIGTVTRFHAAKGMRYLVDAFRHVLDAVPEAWLVLVGQGPEEGMLRERAAALGIARRVVFAGYRDDVQAYYGAFDVTAVPSVEEGFGLVALESQAVGVPVVASRLGGLSDLVAEGRTGHLVPAGEPRPLADRLVRLLQDASARREMGRAGRAASRRFGLEGYVSRLEEIYREMAEEGRT